MNFVTGLLADRYGRRTTMLIGWVAALPMPLAVLAAGSWASVSATNLLLGLQQAICWSTSIFIMLDYAGKENGGLAVGLNETSGAFSRSGVTSIRNDWVCNCRMTLVWAGGQDTWLWLL
jgi:MFS family permease